MWKITNTASVSVKKLKWNDNAGMCLAIFSSHKMWKCGGDLTAFFVTNSGTQAPTLSVLLISSPAQWQASRRFLANTRSIILAVTMFEGRPYKNLGEAFQKPSTLHRATFHLECASQNALAVFCTQLFAVSCCLPSYVWWHLSAWNLAKPPDRHPLECLADFFVSYCRTAISELNNFSINFSCKFFALLLITDEQVVTKQLWRSRELHLSIIIFSTTNLCHEFTLA